MIKREDGLNVKIYKRLWWNTVKNERCSYKKRKRLLPILETPQQEREGKIPGCCRKTQILTKERI
jgi:hypothetical protein